MSDPALIENRILETQITMTFLEWLGKMDTKQLNGNSQSDNRGVQTSIESKEAIRAQKVKILQNLISDKKPTKKVVVKKKARKKPKVEIKKLVVPDKQNDDPKPKKFTQSQSSKSVLHKKATPKPLATKKKNQFFSVSFDMSPVKPRSTLKTTVKADMKRRTSSCMDCSVPVRPTSKRCNECHKAFTKSKSSYSEVVEDSHVKRAQDKSLAVPEKKAVSSGILKLTIKRSAIGNGGKLEPRAKKKILAEDSRSNDEL